MTNGSPKELGFGRAGLGSLVSVYFTWLAVFVETNDVSDQLVSNINPLTTNEKL